MNGYCFPDSSHFDIVIGARLRFVVFKCVNTLIVEVFDDQDLIGKLICSAFGLNVQRNTLRIVASVEPVAVCAAAKTWL